MVSPWSLTFSGNKYLYENNHKKILHVIFILLEYS